MCTQIEIIGHYIWYPKLPSTRQFKAPGTNSKCVRPAIIYSGKSLAKNLTKTKTKNHKENEERLEAINGDMGFDSWRRKENGNWGRPMN